MSIRKAIILAAGYGTRFLPVTKAMPKEMLPVVDKPVIQYVVEDVVASGLKDIIIVTSAQKRAIEDHFDNSFELESVLSNGGKQELLTQVKSIPELANFIYIRQKGAKKGTLPAIQCAYEAMGEEPFLAVWGDDFYYGSPSRSAQLVEVYNEFHAPVLGVMETTDPEAGGRYGFITGEEVRSGWIKVKEIIEKPGKGQAPSPWATCGGFVGTPELMTYADKAAPMPNGEYGYVEAMQLMLQAGQPIYAKKIENSRFYDCGNKLEYMKATIELALKNPEMSVELKDYIQAIK